MSKPLDVAYIPMLDYEEAWNRQKAIVQRLDEGEGAEQMFFSSTHQRIRSAHKIIRSICFSVLKSCVSKGFLCFKLTVAVILLIMARAKSVGYPLLILGRDEDLDLHGYLRKLEQVLMDYLADQGIEAGRKEGYTGVWIGDMKIAAIGIKFNRCKHRRGFVTSHGFAFNISSGIQHAGFQGIVPCGIEQYGVTSLEDITGKSYAVEQVAQEIVPYFNRIFQYQINWVTEKEALQRL